MQTQIVPAAAGFFVVEPIYKADEHVEAIESISREPVVAWRVDPEGATAAVTTYGIMKSRKLYLIQEPNGQVMDHAMRVVVKAGSKQQDADKILSAYFSKPTGG